MNIPLFTPRSVALVGASDGSVDPWSFNARLTRAVVGSTLEEILLVSRSAASIAGRPTVTSVLDSPRPIDVAVLAVPASTLETVLAQCVEAGIPGCIVITADVTRSAREVMVELCDAGIMRIVGPNCIGFVDTVAGVRLFAGGSIPGPPRIGRPVVAISQSGGFASSLIAAGEPIGIGFSHVFTTGEELDVGLEDCLEYALDSLAPGAVVLFVETLRQPMRFRGLARRAAKGGVPLVLLRIGRTAMAREVAMAHTGALVDDWDGTTAALEADGVIACDTFEDLLDVTQLTTTTSAPLDGTVEIVTTSGAMGALAADLAAVAGATLVPAASSLAAGLPALSDLPEVLRNPLDTSNSGGSVTTLRGLRSATGRAEPSRALLFAHSGATYAQAVVDELVALAAQRRRFLIACWPGIPATAAACLLDAGVPQLPDAYRAMRGIKRLATWEAHRHGLAPLDAVAGPAGPAHLLGYVASRAVLDRWAVPSPGYAILDGDEVRLGGLRAPYVVKQAGGVNHKAAVGGVVLDVATAAEVAEVVARFRRGGYDGPIIVEEQAEPGTEVLVDVRRSPFGDLLTVGWGGSDAEQVADVITMCIPLDRDALCTAFSLTRVARVLKRVRQSGAGDVLALCHAMVEAFAADPTVLEMEVNPVIVNRHGAVAVDARALVPEDSE